MTPYLKLRVDAHGSSPHTVVHVFAGPDADHLALCGVLNMLHHEYEALRQQLLWGDLARVASLSIDDRREQATREAGRAQLENGSTP